MSPQAQTLQYPAGLKETPASLRDIITVKTSLAALLAEETELMDKMQLAKVGALQERKLKLTSMLERYMRYVTKHPEVLTGVSGEEKEELRRVAGDFQRILKKNYDTLLVARAVNKTVVKCVTQTMARKHQNPVYNARAAKVNHRPLPLSITLNETV